MSKCSYNYFTGTILTAASKDNGKKGKNIEGCMILSLRLFTKWSTSDYKIQLTM